MAESPQQEANPEVQSDAPIGPGVEPDADALEQLSQSEMLVHEAQDDAPTAEGGPEPEQDIEDYMAQLMARVNGFSSTGPGPPVVAEVVEPEPAPKKSTSESSAAAPEPKTRKPPVTESRVELSSMRELANMSNRQALDDYSVKRLIGMLRAKLFVGAFASAMSLLLMSISKSVESFEFMGAVACGVVGLVWSFQYNSMLRRVNKIASTGDPS